MSHFFTGAPDTQTNKFILAFFRGPTPERFYKEGKSLQYIAKSMGFDLGGVNTVWAETYIKGQLQYPR
jgi:hypothetical protein